MRTETCRRSAISLFDSPACASAATSRSRPVIGNGVSAALDWSRYSFVNVDLSVHLHRMPVSEWVCLDAVTTVEPEGIGIADTALADERGAIGRAVQTLVVREREA